MGDRMVFQKILGNLLNMKRMLQTKKVIGYFAAIVLCGIFLISCKTNFVSLRIENYQPAKEELPTDIQSITLMNRSMTRQFSNFREDSLQNYFYRNDYQLSKIILDSTACDTTLRAVAALLFESGRYDVVIPVDRNIKRSQSFAEIPDTLSQAQVSEICKNYNTDALMVLERFSTKVMADYTSEKNMSERPPYSYQYYASLDLAYNALFRIYKPGEKAVVKTIDLNDTINWEAADYTNERLFKQLPTIKQALINAGIKVALDVDSKLSPDWIPDNRGYFVFSQKNDKGQQLMQENNTSEAEKYWNELAQSKDKRIRSKAEFNLALASELNGDLDSAIQWGLKSYYTFYRHQTEAYLKKLQARKETLQKTK